MHVKILEKPDVAALARASGLNATPERVSSLAATLPIVNAIRETLLARSHRLESEPAHVFAPAKSEDVE